MCHTSWSARVFFAAWGSRDPPNRTSTAAVGRIPRLRRCPADPSLWGAFPLSPSLLHTMIGVQVWSRSSNTYMEVFRLDRSKHPCLESLPETLCFATAVYTRRAHPV